MWQVLCQGETRGEKASNSDSGPRRLLRGGSLDLSNRRRKTLQNRCGEGGQAELKGSAGCGVEVQGQFKGRRAPGAGLGEGEGRGRAGGRVDRGLESLQNGRLRLTCVVMEWGTKGK